MMEQKGDQPILIIEISQRKFTSRTIADMKHEIDTLSRKHAAISRLECRAHGPEDLYDYSLSILGDRGTARLFDVESYA